MSKNRLELKEEKNNKIEFVVNCLSDLIRVICHEREEDKKAITKAIHDWALKHKHDVP